MTVNGEENEGIEPQVGAGAITELARAIDDLDMLTDAGTGPRVNVGVVSGGTRANVIAAEARAEVDGHR